MKTIALCLTTLFTFTISFSQGTTPYDVASVKAAYKIKYNYLQNCIQLKDETATMFWNMYLEYHDIMIQLDTDIAQCKAVLASNNNSCKETITYLNKLNFTKSKVNKKFLRESKRFLKHSNNSDYFGFIEAYQIGL